MGSRTIRNRSQQDPNSGRARPRAAGALLALVVGAAVTWPVAERSRAEPASPVLAIEQLVDGSGDGTWPLDLPYGVVVAGSGDILVTGYDSHNAFRIAPDGEITQVLDASGDGVHAIENAFTCAIDASGNAFVCGLISDNVFRITPAGVVTQIVDASGDGVNPLDAPYDVATDADGNVYVACYQSSNVFRVTPAGVVTEILDATGDGVNPADSPYAIAVGADGSAYVACNASDNVFSVSPAGVVTQILDSSGDGVHAFEQPIGVAVDVDHNVYTSARFTRNAFKITPEGAVTQIIDSTGDGVNPLDGAWDIQVDAFGNAYVASRYTSGLFRICPTGEIDRILGPGGDGIHTFDTPFGVAIDGAGRVLVTGLVSDNVFRIQLAPPPADFALGTKLAGAIDEDGDVDRFTFNATAGTKVKLKVKARGAAWSPGCILSDARGDQLVGLGDTSTSKGRVARANVTIPSTGLWTVAVSHAADFLPPGGDYLAKTRGSFPRKASQVVEVGTEGGEMVIHGVPGMVLTRLTVKALKPKGIFAMVEGMPANLLPRVESLAIGLEAVDLTGRLETTGSGRIVKGRDIPLDYTVPYVLRIAGVDGTVGYAKVTARFKVPRGKGGLDEDGGSF